MLQRSPLQVTYMYIHVCTSSILSGKRHRESKVSFPWMQEHNTMALTSAQSWISFFYMYMYMYVRPFKGDGWGVEGDVGWGEYTV